MIYRLKFADRALTPVWDDETYCSTAAVMSAYQSCIADPEPEWASVYVTAQAVGDERETIVTGYAFD